jgi:hypothetical protein
MGGATYFSKRQLDIASSAAHNAALATCISWFDMHKTSAECNTTIEASLLPPPQDKRLSAPQLSPVAFAFALIWFHLALALVLILLNHIRVRQRVVDQESMVENDTPLLGQAIGGVSDHLPLFHNTAKVTYEGHHQSFRNGEAFYGAEGLRRRIRLLEEDLQPFG